jgi:hypothetical protein
MTPTDPKTPGGDDREDRTPQGRRGPRPGGHGSYKIGGEPATGQTWHEAPPPPPPPSGRYVPPAAAAAAAFDDGVPHRHREPGEEDPLHNADVEHEHSDINVRAVIGSAIVLFVVAALAQLLMWALFVVFDRQAAANDPSISHLAAPPTTMPSNQIGTPVFTPETVAAPHLLTNEPLNLQQQRDKEQKVLHGYGWVNQATGVARMPIDEAKKLIVERGLPVSEGVEVAPTLGTHLPARGESSGGRIITVPAPETGGAAPAAPEGGQSQPSGDQPAAPAHGEPAKPQGRGGH